MGQEASLTDADRTLGFLQGGGEMGALMRAKDWHSTSLGPPSTWPRSLRAVVRLVLNTGHPMYIFWGADGACLYNDAYRASIGPERHPGSLGRPAQEVWAEIWDAIGPQIDQVMAGQGATWHENQLVPITRHGLREDVYWTYSYCPIDDEDAPSSVGGVLVVCTETTAQVEAARQLSLSEERLQLALSGGRGIGTWDWDIVHDRVVADARFARLYGVDPEKARDGAPIAEFFVAMHPDDVGAVQARIAEVLKTGESFSEEYRLVQPDGSVRWVVAEGHCLLAPDGTPLRFPGVTFDITDRKTIEKRLRVLNADLERQIIERSSERGTTWQVSPMLLSVIDMADGRFARVNPAWTSTLGWAEEELSGAPYIDFLHPDDLAPSLAAFEEVKRGIPVLHFENRYRAKDGAYHWLSWVAVPEAGKLYSTTRDVTQEKAQAQLLAERTRERDRAWRLSQDLQVVADAEGRLLAVNDSWTRLLGWPESELTGADFRGLVHPDDLEMTLETFAHSRDEPLTAPYEFRLRHKAGGYRWFAWTGSFEEGRFFASGRYTSPEREQAEALARTAEALRQAQKMEAVGQLTGGLAHDFNNILAGLSGSLEMLQARIAQGRFEAVDRYINAGMGAIKRAAALTHRLLAFSRRQTLDPKATDVNRLIGGMEELIRRTAGPGIHVEVVGAGGLWPTLVDPNQLENALLNLCLNARDAMPEGGRLTIETANKWLDDRTALERDLPPGQYVSLCVTDSGTGMAPDVIAKAFEPFFTTKPIGEGTGLGLSMIYGFARQSGGQVRIYSELGAGTTVCVYLPRHAGGAASEQGPASPAEQRPEGDGEVVLVIDDEPVIRMLIADVLVDLGYLGVEAVDGPSGLRLLQSLSRVDLLITDVGLPGGLNGRQVADAARAARPELKVLFITGYAENAAIGNGHLDHGMQVLTKPFGMDQLATKIRSVMEQR